MIDADRFISEIEQRSVIWNPDSPEYANKIMKKNAWEEMCYLFYDDFNLKGAAEKNELCRNLQRKWRSLRDSFVRDVKHRKMENKFNSGRSNRRTYIYYESLRFLLPTVENRKSASSLDGGDTQEIERDDENSEDKKNDDTPDQEKVESIKSREGERPKLSFKTPKPMKRKTYHIGDIEAEFVTSTNERFEPDNYSLYRKEADDEDRLFLLSLLRDLKRIPDDFKINAKVEIMLMLQKYQKQKLPKVSYREMPFNMHGQHFLSTASCPVIPSVETSCSPLSSLGHMQPQMTLSQPGSSPGGSDSASDSVDY